MKKIVFFIALFTISFGLQAQQDAWDIYVPGEEMSYRIPDGQYSQTDGPGDVVIYSNGPLVTHPGGGAGGADASMLQTSLSLSTYGFGHQISQGFWIADDFTVPSGGWNIEGFGFYAYQTGSTLTPTFVNVHILIYDDSPLTNPTANIVFGDHMTNRLTGSQFSNIYRVLEGALLNTTRPIMLVDCKFDLHLAPGTYWVAWQMDGSLGSGPWAPPITILGQTTTGNGIQYTTAWASAVDTGTGTGQGFPFLIYGLDNVIPISNWALFIGIGLILVFAVVRFRKIV